MDVFQNTLHTFLDLLLEAVPLFLVGAILGAGLEAWLKPGWIERSIGSGHRSVAGAALAGAVLPGCAMSTMPLAQSLRRRGAAVGTLTAFIMIAPILSPHTIFLTATLVSVPMAIGRMILSLFVTLALGTVLNSMERSGRLTPVVNSTAVDDQCCSVGAAVEKSSPWRRFVVQFWSSLRSLTPYLLGGLFVAALISATVPADTIHKYLRGGWTAYLFASLIAFPIYVCDGGEIPLTRALLAMGVGPGPAFCFMLASVGTCLPTIAMATRIIGWRATVIYVIAWLLLAVGGGLLMDLWL